jgi:hypothetical protein
MGMTGELKDRWTPAEFIQRAAVYAVPGAVVIGLSFASDPTLGLLLTVVIGVVLGSLLAVGVIGLGVAAGIGEAERRRGTGAARSGERKSLRAETSRSEPDNA